MSKHILLTVLMLALAAPAFAETQPPLNPPPPDTGVGERLGESLDRGLNRLGEKIRKGWAEIRQSVDELSVQGRVYGRLHWDKALAKAPIDVTVQEENTITLSGTVADEAARTTAVNLSQSTVGVSRVVDHLTIASPTITSVPTETPATPVPQTSAVPPLDVPRK